MTQCAEKIEKLMASIADLQHEHERLKERLSSIEFLINKGIRRVDNGETFAD